MGKLPCGHFNLDPECVGCSKLKADWYQKLSTIDPDWKDIEYGIDTPERLYEPVDKDAIDPITTLYYDMIMSVHFEWVNKGRSKRDCLIAELLANQTGNTGTQEGIEAVLRARRLKPNSRFTVRQTIKEIHQIVLKKAKPHLCVEQVFSLRPMDSKPSKDDANGKTDKSTALSLRAA